MKTMKYFIIATALATTLGPVSVYAMDQDREHKEAAAAEGLTVEQANAALWDAAEVGNLAVVTKMLAVESIDVNVTNDRDVTPLMMAAGHGHVEVVLALIKGKALVDEVNLGGGTALMIAVCKGHADVVEALIKAGANGNQASRDGKTAVSLASKIILDVIAKAREAMPESADYVRSVEHTIQNLPVMLALAVDSERPGQQRMVPWLLRSASQDDQECGICLNRFADLVGKKAELRRASRGCRDLVCDICEQQLKVRAAAEPHDDQEGGGILFEDDEGGERWGGTGTINFTRCAVCRAGNDKEFKPTADQEQEFAQLAQLFREYEHGRGLLRKRKALAQDESVLSPKKQNKSEEETKESEESTQEREEPQPDADGFYD